MGSTSASIQEESESELWGMMRGAHREQVRLQLFDMHAAYARALAWKMFKRRSYGDLEFQELHQLANIALLEAIDAFDPAREARFRTYAAHRILGNISDGIARMSEVRRQQSVRARTRRERMRSLVDEDVSQLSGRDALAALTELAMGIAIGVMLEETGLYRDENTATAHTRLATAYESAAWHELVVRLARELDGLPEREAVILRRHYVDAVDFETLGRLMSLSKGRISQLHRSALATLRKRLARYGHFSLER
jgi:RNA polymerase sigma factor for flagellar operon FliA